MTSPRPKLVLCAGVPRSGSTWVFNAARLILEPHGPVEGRWIEDLDTKSASDAGTDATRLVKLHEFDAELAARADAVLTSRRNLVEIGASAWRLGWVDTDASLLAFLEGVIWKHAQWRGVSGYELAYETLRSDPEREVIRIADALGLPVGAARASEIIERINTQRYEGPEGTYDPQTLLHPNHVSKGNNRLNGDQEAMIRSRFESWLTEHGYAS